MCGYIKYRACKCWVLDGHHQVTKCLPAVGCCGISRLHLLGSRWPAGCWRHVSRAFLGTREWSLPPPSNVCTNRACLGLGTEYMWHYLILLPLPTPQKWTVHFSEGSQCQQCVSRVGIWPSKFLGGPACTTYSGTSYQRPEWLLRCAERPKYKVRIHDEVSLMYLARTSSSAATKAETARG